MQNRPDDSTLALVKRLARLASSPTGAELLTTIQLLRQPFLKLEPPSQPGPEEAGPARQIGQWHLGADGVYRRRAEDKDAWRAWADVAAFPLRQAGRRLLLLGESVARGYLYDPALTLATVLQEYLAADDQEPWEIVDLARIDLNDLQLVQLMHQAACLEPDVVVMFAGNNWLHFRGLSPADTERIVAGGERGFAATRELFERELLPRACRRVLDELGRRFPAARKIVVVPEFNLAGWRDDVEGAFPCAPYRDPARLLDAPEALGEALARGAWGTVRRLADAVEGETGRSSYLPFYARGQAALAEGRTGEALVQLALAKDAAVGVPGPATPRCPTVVQETLKRESRERGFTVIDVPALMQAEGAGPVPGPDYFLDYCHLSAKGLHLVARHVAGDLRQASGDALPDRYRPAADVGLAYFLAAVHNAHFGQSKATLRRLVERGLALDPELAALLELYLEFQPSDAPRWLHRAFQVAAREPLVERYFSLGRRWDKFADWQLYEAVAQALGEAPAGARVARIAAARDQATGKTADLLDDEHRSETFRHFLFSRVFAFYQAHTRTSRFFLPLARPTGLGLALEARIPPATRRLDAGVLAVAVNGRLVARLEVGQSWRKLAVEVDPQATIAGVNTITLAWPKSFPDWETFREAYARNLTSQASTHVYPIFGELFSFTAGKRSACAP